MIVFVLTLTAFAATSFGALELRLDTVNKEFALFGSDTGSPSTGIVSSFRWACETPIAPTGSYNDIDVYSSPAAYTVSAGTTGNQIFHYDINMAIAQTTNGAFRMQLLVDDIPNLTLTGTGEYQSYAGLSADAQISLESTIGQVLVQDIGTGMSNINVTPEPATMSLLALGGMAILRRRKK